VGDHGRAGVVQRGARVDDVMAVPEAVRELSNFEIVPDA